MSVTKKLFILVPALTPDGPIKGAFALANFLIREREVTLVTLKPGAGAHAPLDKRIQHVSLANCKGILARISAYRQLLRSHGGRSSCSSLSMCFSADLVNVFCHQQAVTSTSIRGNLMQNYRIDYGWRGVLLAGFHLFTTRWFDHCIAMTQPMADQTRRYGARQPEIIGNFVDEDYLDQFRAQRNPAGPLRFVYVASMSPRKQPLQLLQAFADLLSRGTQGRLDMIGSGPLLAAAVEASKVLGLAEHVHFHGQLDNPYPLIASADTLVLPSLSEGLSRAAMEALHLGVPCVLRDVDGNADLITPHVNGMLFDTDTELPNAMRAAAAIGRGQKENLRLSLLPEAYRQVDCATQYMRIMERAHG